jgi:hypothetical protein
LIGAFWSAEVDPRLSSSEPQEMGRMVAYDSNGHQDMENVGTYDTVKNMITYIDNIIS